MRETGNTTIFSCPSCGHPGAQTVELYLDIHVGATYACDECGQQVIFEAMTVAEYSVYCKWQYEGGKAL